MHRVELSCLGMSMAIFDLGWTSELVPYMFHQLLAVLQCMYPFACMHGNAPLSLCLVVISTVLDDQPGLRICVWICKLCFRDYCALTAATTL